jgi:molybdopterin-guanine dinucleotide biosynthesis protein A
MGRDKARLSYRGTTLIEHAIALARGVTPDVRVLCGPKPRYEEFGAPVIADPVCGVGPLGGLYGGLLQAWADGRDRTFWIAVDLPLVTAEFLGGLVSGLDTAEVVMARTSRGDEPLCAAFRTEAALVAVRRALVDGRLKLTAALESLSVRRVEADPAAFVNVNTLDDYDLLSRH